MFGNNQNVLGQHQTSTLQTMHIIITITIPSLSLPDSFWCLFENTFKLPEPYWWLQTECSQHIVMA